MKICLYSPYVPKHTGGGEKYLLDVAQSLAQKHQVFLAVSESLDEAKEKKIRDQYERFLNRSLAKITFISTPLGTSASWLTKLWWTNQFDVLYYLTDGSLFFSLANKNILHIQVPLKLNKRSPLEQLKLLNWDVKNTNSEFTKSVVEKSWPTKINLVHQPLVELTEQLNGAEKVNLKPKEKIILNVGRFFTQLHAKRQDVLVKMFKHLLEEEPKISRGWKLVLIGAVEDEAFAEKIKSLAKDLPIEIYHQVDRKQLISWYERASIYWHAAGFEINEKEHPEKVEHFGISTAEAMLAGCAPVVIGKGGQIEVVGPELKEWLWQTQTEGIHKTIQLLSDPELLQQVQLQAHDQALTFGHSPFEKKLEQMISDD